MFTESVLPLKLSYWNSGFGVLSGIPVRVMTHRIRRLFLNQLDISTAERKNSRQILGYRITLMYSQLVWVSEYEEKLVRRIQLYSVVLFLTASTATAASGVSVYQSSCIACHGIGVAGAPKLGDKQAWQSRIAQGLELMAEHAIKGFKSPGSRVGMPAKGGKGSLGNDDIRAAVEYMVSKSR